MTTLSMPIRSLWFNSFFAPKMQITEFRQLGRCFEVNLSVISLFFNRLYGVGVLIFAVFVITILTYLNR